GAFGYRNNQFFPGVAFSGARELAYANVEFYDGERLNSVQEEVWRGQVSTLWPLMLRRDYTLYLDTSFSVTQRSNGAVVEPQPGFIYPQVPDQGRFTALNLGLIFS